MTADRRTRGPADARTRVARCGARAYPRAMTCAPRPLLLALGLLLACGPGPSSDCGEIDPPKAGEHCEKDGDVCQLVDPCTTPPLECKSGKWQEAVTNCTDSDTAPGSTTSDLPTTSPTDPSDTATSGDEPVPCGEQLPPEGSACAPDGAQCSPNEHPCDPYTAAMCDAGKWQHYEVGPGDPMECGEFVPCDPQNIPPEGSKCALEGEGCSPGCEDPCEFCNLVVCEDGTWQRVEVFPAPCLDCESVCEFVVPAACAGGPPDAGTCVTGCHADQDGECHVAFDQMLACIGEMPTFTCDAETRPVVAGCEAQFDTLYMCTGI